VCSLCDNFAFLSQDARFTPLCFSSLAGLWLFVYWVEFSLVSNSTFITFTAKKKKKTFYNCFLFPWEFKILISLVIQDKHWVENAVLCTKEWTSLFICSALPPVSWIVHHSLSIITLGVI
jgi:hypothetical protein